MSGWYAMQRGWQDDPFFASEPFTEREAWEWLIGNAAYQQTRRRVGHEIIDLEAGSLAASLRYMQKAWRWKSDKRVRGFLARLEAESMISTGKSEGQKWTRIAICNYSRFQQSGRSQDAAGTQSGRKSNKENNSSSSLRSEEEEEEARGREAVDPIPRQPDPTADLEQGFSQPSLVDDDAMPPTMPEVVIADWNLMCERMAGAFPGRATPRRATVTKSRSRRIVEIAKEYRWDIGDWSGTFSNLERDPFWRGTGRKNVPTTIDALLKPNPGKDPHIKAISELDNAPRDEIERDVALGRIDQREANILRGMRELQRDDRREPEACDGRYGF